MQGYKKKAEEQIKEGRKEGKKQANEAKKNGIKVKMKQSSQKGEKEERE